MTVAAVPRRESRAAEKRPHGVPAAFRKLDHVPALAESRYRLLRALLAENPSPDAAIRAIESDIGLTVATPRAANGAGSDYRRGIAAIPRAFDVLTPAGLETLARGIETVDFFERLPGWEITPEILRRHSAATQRVADHLGRDLDVEARDELRVCA